MNRIAGMALGLVLALATSASADRAEKPRDGKPRDGRLPEQTADFWREVTSPGHVRARTLLRHGIHDLIQAMRTSDSRVRTRIDDRIAQAHAENAIVKFHLAHRHAPHDPEPLYLLAWTRSSWREPSAPEALTPDDEEAIELFERLRLIDPAYQASRVAFHLGILYTRAHDYPRAAREYERSLARMLLPHRGPPTWRTLKDVMADRLFGPTEAAITHYNLGDVVMAQGQLERAVSHYERAVQEAARNPGQVGTMLLALWGGAVALDRLGERGAALERVRKAIQLDEHGPMGILENDNVFFEPDYEIHYYKGLGYLVLADERDEGAERLDALRRARRAWTAFLDQGGAGSAWAELAERHLERVEQRIADLSLPVRD